MSKKVHWFWQQQLYLFYAVICRFYGEHASYFRQISIIMAAISVICAVMVVKADIERKRQIRKELQELIMQEGCHR